jgi:hypothetical protein
LTFACASSCATGAARLARARHPFSGREKRTGRYGTGIPARPGFIGFFRIGAESIRIRKMIGAAVIKPIPAHGL